MWALGNHPRNSDRPQWLWLTLSVVLGMGLGGYVWFNPVQLEPAVAALLVVCATALAGLVLALNRQLRIVRAQRGRALAKSAATGWQLCEGLNKQDPCLAECAERRVHALQNELADLRVRERLLQDQAHHDDLTGLANRNLLADRFSFAVERAKRSGQSFALLMVDLNDFKTVNDNYGHAAGDAVLIAIAKRLVGALRAADTVARLGGDEFVLIVESIEDARELNQLGQKLFDTLSQPIVLDSGVVVTNGASVGLAMYPDDGADMNDLLNVADQAMYECKSSGLMGLH